MIAVTGSEGFIGTNLVQSLERIYDVKRLDKAGGGDLFDTNLPGWLAGVDAVIHLAANADVRSGWNHPGMDLQTNLYGTQVLLEALRLGYDQKKPPRLIFASTGSVYHPSSHVHHEACPCHATSLYAASKIGAEQLIAAYAAAGHISATVLRFVSVLGPHYSHGHLIDFVSRLRANPDQFQVLGSGQQQKAYIHVDDVVAAVSQILWRNNGYMNFEVFNVGTEHFVTPLESARIVADEMGLDPQINPGGESWVGDNPDIRLSTARLEQTGWERQWSIEESIRDTIQWLLKNPSPSMPTS